MTNFADIEERILGGTTARRGDVVITSGEGCWVYDERGRKYLDLGSAQGVAMLGHCHPGVTAAIQKQAETLTLCPSYLYNDMRAAFAQFGQDILRNLVKGWLVAKEICLVVEQSLDHFSGKVAVFGIFVGSIEQARKLVEAVKAMLAEHARQG